LDNAFEFYDNFNTLMKRRKIKQEKNEEAQSISKAHILA